MFISVGIISGHYPFQNFVRTFHRLGKWVFCAMGNSMQFDREKYKYKSKKPTATPRLLDFDQQNTFLRINIIL